MQQRDQESSVLFNLGEVMRLEQQRVAEEEARARRTIRDAQEQREAERARAWAKQAAEVADRKAAEREAERDAVAWRTRLQTEREAALLQVRLQVEAEARLRAERLALERDVALRDSGSTGGRGGWVVAGLAVVGLATGAWFFFVDHARGEAERARAVSERVARAAQAEASRIDALTRELGSLRAVREASATAPPSPVAPSPSAGEGSRSTTGARSHRRPRSRARVGPGRATRRPARKGDPLSGLDDDDDDPLRGL